VISLLKKRPMFTSVFSKCTLRDTDVSVVRQTLMRVWPKNIFHIATTATRLISAGISRDAQHAKRLDTATKIINAKIGARSTRLVVPLIASSLFVASQG
jgi:hypothetical protein